REQRWSRPPSLRLQRLARRRRHQGRDRPRRHRRDRLPRLREPPLRDRHPRHRPAPARPRPAPPGSSRAQAAGNRFWASDQENHRLNCKHMDAEVVRIAGITCALVVALSLTILIGAVLLRGAIALYNIMAGVRGTSFSVPEPSFINSLAIILVTT